MVLTGGMADGTDFLTECARLASPIQEYRTGLAFRIPGRWSARPARHGDLVPLAPVRPYAVALGLARAGSRSRVAWARGPGPGGPERGPPPPRPRRAQDKKGGTPQHPAPPPPLARHPPDHPPRLPRYPPRLPRHPGRARIVAASFIPN